MDLKSTRAYTLITDVIHKLNLDLDGYTILTEVGSENFVFTPIIAALARAHKVYAWTKDSKYGSANENINACKNLMKKFSIDEEKIIFLANDRDNKHINDSDIITNLGFIRPLNREFLKNLKKNAVVSYMCEAWEVRDGDVDISYCKENNIPVAGVWENHPELEIFNGCGPLCAKICFEAGYEIYQNRITIISKDHFGAIAKSSFEGLGAKSVKIFPSLDSIVNKEDITGVDFIFIADYTTDLTHIGKGGYKYPELIKNTQIIHLSGKIDYSFCVKNDISIYPERNGFSKRMTFSLAHLGVKPVIELHASGLKVGECLIKKEKSELVQII